MVALQQEARMLNDKKPEATTLRERARQEDAIFLGWQRTRVGGAFALYTITAAGHPSLGSTVTDRGLRKLNLQIPLTPMQPAEKV